MHRLKYAVLFSAVTTGFSSTVGAQEVRFISSNVEVTGIDSQQFEVLEPINGVQIRDSGDYYLRNDSGLVCSNGGIDDVCLLPGGEVFSVDIDTSNPTNSFNIQARRRLLGSDDCQGPEVTGLSLWDAEDNRHLVQFDPAFDASFATDSVDPSFRFDSVTEIDGARFPGGFTLAAVSNRCTERVEFQLRGQTEESVIAADRLEEIGNRYFPVSGMSGGIFNRWVVTNALLCEPALRTVSFLTHCLSVEIEAIPYSATGVPGAAFKQKVLMYAGTSGGDGGCLSPLQYRCDFNGNGRTGSVPGTCVDSNGTVVQMKWPEYQGSTYKAVDDRFEVSSGSSRFNVLGNDTVIRRDGREGTGFSRDQMVVHIITPPRNGVLIPGASSGEMSYMQQREDTRDFFEYLILEPNGTVEGDLICSGGVSLGRVDLSLLAEQPNSPPSINSVSPSPVNVPVDESVPVTINATDDRGISGYGATSDNVDIAVVDDGGPMFNVTGISAGTTRITFTVTDSDNVSRTRDVVVNVNRVVVPETNQPPQINSISQNPINVDVGATESVMVTASDDRGIAGYAARSTDESRTTVSGGGPSFTVRGVAQGRAEIVFTVTDSDGVPETRRVPVNISDSLPPEDNCDYSNAVNQNGWGWNPVANVSCAPLEQQPPVTQPPTTQPPTTQPPTGVSNSCDYSNAASNSGYGWDPVAGVSCPPRDQQQPTTQPPTTQPPNTGNCDYSNAASQGGWGWNPVAGESCPPVGQSEPSGGQSTSPEPSSPPQSSGGSCDYSNAASQGGWGWNPVAGESCPPSDNSSIVPSVPTDDNCDYSGAANQNGWGWDSEAGESCPPR